MKRLIVIVVAVVLCGPTAWAATRPAHASTVSGHRPRIGAAIAVHVRPFGRTPVHPLVPHRAPARSAKASAQHPAVRHTTARLKPSGYAGMHSAATSRSSRR